ncbi:hypothetical protein GCM10027610_128950 [Dactylosporangium cerinum]
MGLLRRLLGREPAWVERWAVYPGEIGDGLAMYNIDLGAVEVAPVARLPQRLDVDFTYAGDGTSGMPADAELGVIHALDEAVRQALRGLRGAMVGRVVTAGTGRITGYLPEGATAPALPDFPALSPVATLSSDPGWTRVREELTPDAWQRNIMDDNQVVQELEGTATGSASPGRWSSSRTSPPPTTPRRPPRTCATSASRSPSSAATRPTSSCRRSGGTRSSHRRCTR